MDIETAARAAYHVRQLEEKELKRKKLHPGMLCFRKYRCRKRGSLRNP